MQSEVELGLKTCYLCCGELKIDTASITIIVWVLQILLFLKLKTLGMLWKEKMARHKSWMSICFHFVVKRSKCADTWMVIIDKSSKCQELLKDKAKK